MSVGYYFRLLGKISKSRLHRPVHGGYPEVPMTIKPTIYEVMMAHSEQLRRGETEPGSYWMTVGQLNDLARPGVKTR